MPAKQKLSPTELQAARAAAQKIIDIVTAEGFNEEPFLSFAEKCRKMKTAKRQKR